jgi:hypothetical protein
MSAGAFSANIPAVADRRYKTRRRPDIITPGLRVFFGVDRQIFGRRIG